MEFIQKILYDVFKFFLKIFLKQSIPKKIIRKLGFEKEPNDFFDVYNDALFDIRLEKRPKEVYIFYKNFEILKIFHKWIYEKNINLESEIRLCIERVNELYFLKKIIRDFDNEISHFKEIFKQKAMVKRKVWEAFTDHTTPSNIQKIPSCLTSDIPYIDIKKFVGRDDDLKNITDILGKESAVVVVNGLGGIGKTTIAKAFIQNLTKTKKISHFAWINASFELKAAFAYNDILIENLNLKITKDDDEDKRFDLIINALQRLDGIKLIIADNIKIEEKEAVNKLNGLINSGWKIIYTSRDQFGGIREYPLDYLSPDKARELFYLYYKREKNDPLVDSIIKDNAGFHTLTIELLAKTAAENPELSLNNLKEKLDKEGLNVSEAVRIDTPYSNEDHIYNILNFAFDITGFREREDIKVILLQFSVLPSTQIEYNELKDFLQIKDETIKFIEILNELNKKGWINKTIIDEKQYYFMHRVLQDVIRNKLNPTPQSCDRLIDSLMWKLRVDYDKGENPLSKAKYIPCGVSLLNNIKITIFEKDKGLENFASLANNLSLIYQDKGNYDEALKYQLKAIEIKEKVLEKDHPDLASLYSNLSLIYKDLGNYNEALRYQLKAIEIREKALEKDHPDLAISYSNLSLIYKDRGNYDEALKYQFKAIEIRKKILEKDHPDLAISYNNLSMIYWAISYHEEALNYQLKAIEVSERVLEKDHPDLATLYSNLSLIYKDKGNYDEALEYQFKSIEIRKKMLEKDHPLLAISYNNLSLIYRDEGNYEEALDYQLKAQEIYEKVLEKDHPLLATSNNNLSLIYRDKGNYGEALNYQLKSIAIREKVLEKDHPDLAASYINIASIYYYKKEYKIAKEYIDKGIQILEYKFPSEHPKLDTARKWKENIEKELKK